MSDLHVVLGATGGVGRALVAELAARGTPVRAVSRGITAADVPAGVQPLAADVTDTAGAARAVAGAAVVHHAARPAYTRWREEFPALTATVADATARVGARLVMADNLYAYGPSDGPLRETTPQRATDTKGVVRRDMAADLLARHQRGDLPVALGRASDYLGPGGVSSNLGEPLFERALAGKPAQWVGRLEAPHTVHFLPDVARGLVRLADHADAPGRAWHLPAASPLTGQQVVDHVSAALGRPVRVKAAGPRMLRLLGVAVPMLRELAGVAYQWQQPWVVDDSAFLTELGPLPVTPHDEAFAATAAWWRERAGAVPVG